MKRKNYRKRWGRNDRRERERETKKGEKERRGI